MRSDGQSDKEKIGRYILSNLTSIFMEGWRELMSFNKETSMYEGYIYLILNDIYPEKIYVGQTYQELSIRWSGHIWQMKKHSTTDMLHNAMEKHGKEHFAMEGIEKCVSTTKNILIEN